MSLGWILLIVVVVLLILWVILGYNGLVKRKNNVEEAFSTMDVYLKKRYDLIPNLVETVKGYASHEKETLQKVVEARNFAQNATELDEKVNGENMLEGTLKSLFAISENYPDLKANANFMDLQKQLQAIENDIANSRKYYNAVVKDYNNRVMVFPNSILAKLFKFGKLPMFEVAAETERENVKVDFNK